MTSKEVAKVEPQALDAVKSLVDLQGWADALMRNADFQEVNPDYMAMRIMTDTLSATTADDILADKGIDGLQDLVPDIDGAKWGPFTVLDLYVARSNQIVGYACYVHMELYHEEFERTFRTTTGAGQIQAQLLAFVNAGIWPIRASFKRLKSVDKGGRHILRMFPPD